MKILFITMEEKKKKKKRKRNLYVFMTTKNVLINKSLQQHILSHCRQHTCSMNSHVCSCFRYVEAGILVAMHFRIMSCGPFVIIFSKIL